jgi:phosphinothricin acetyltransferase
MHDVRIRQATFQDAAAIAAIYNQAIASSTATFDTLPESPDDRVVWLEEHTAPQHPVLVAERDGRVIGWAALSRYSTRCGLGTALSEALLEAGRAGGVHAVVSRICTENAASLAMARKLGFFEVGVMREVGVKFGRSLDVMWMEMIL